MKIISQLAHLPELLRKLLTVLWLTFDIYLLYFGFLAALCCCVLLLFCPVRAYQQGLVHGGLDLLTLNILCSVIDVHFAMSQGLVQRVPIVGSKILAYFQHNVRYLTSHREIYLLVIPLYSLSYWIFKYLHVQKQSLSPDVTQDTLQHQPAAPVSRHHPQPETQLTQVASLQDDEQLTQQLPMHAKSVFLNHGIKKDKEASPYAKILKPQTNLKLKVLKPGPLNQLFEQVPEVVPEVNDVHKEMIRTIESLFQDFDIPASISKCVVGYAVVIFAIETSKRIKLDILKKIEPDLAAALGEQVKITEHNALGIPLCIEIPHKHKVTLRMNQVLARIPPRTTLPPLSFTLGITLSGEVYRVQMDDLPHLLIAGTTGSGKSVCLHTIITGLILTTPVTSNDFIMIDPKVIELNFYSKLPNLLMPIIHDHHDAHLALSWLIEEMERRYALLSQFNVRNIKEYNKHHTQLHRPQQLKSIVLIIDEFGDLALDKSSNFSTLIIKLAQKSRAAGIYIILTTQRPSASIVTGLLKANIPSRIAMQVASKIESRIILDHNGAEALKGNGDLLFYRPGAALVRMQSPYISPQEIMKIAEFWS